jgi:hypothetical protein
LDNLKKEDRLRKIKFGKIGRAIARLFKLKKRVEITFRDIEKERLTWILQRALDSKLSPARREKFQEEFWQAIGKQNPEVLNGRWHIILDRGRGALVVRSGAPEEWK